MHTFTKTLIVTALATPLAMTARLQQSALQTGALPTLAAVTTDQGRISSQGAWSLTESPDGRFDAFAAGDSIRVYDRQTRTTTPIASAGVSELNWSRKGGMISFVKREENGERVFPWILPVDAATGRATGPARQVSMRPAIRLDEAAAFSPDDRFVAFASIVHDSGFVVVAPSNGGRERVLHAAPGSANRAAISPDGKWVYFSVVTPGPMPSQALHRVPFAGGAEETLAPLALSSLFIGISNDGKLLAWYEEGHPRGGAPATIVIADPNGKRLGMLRNVTGATKSWSSKPGTLLTKKVDYSFATRTVPIGGGPITTVGASGTGEWPAAWSPDNRFLLTRTAGDQWIVRTAKGDSVRRIAAPGMSSNILPGWGNALAWSPDGKFVAYPTRSADGRSSASRLLLIDIGTGGVRTLVDASGEIGRLHWRADAQGLQYVQQQPNSQSLMETSLAGVTRTLASGLASARLVALRPLTDSTLLYVSKDSLSLLSSQGKLIRLLQKRAAKRLGHLNIGYGVSSDGQRIAHIEDFDDPAKHEIHIIPTSGAPIRTIAFRLDYEVFNPYFAGSDALVFLGNIVRSKVAHYADAFAVSLSSGVPRNLTAGDPVTDVDYLTVSPDGRTLAYQAELGPVFPTRMLEVDVSAALRNSTGAKRN